MNDEGLVHAVQKSKITKPLFDVFTCKVIYFQITNVRFLSHVDGGT